MMFPSSLIAAPDTAHIVLITTCTPWERRFVRAAIYFPYSLSPPIISAFFTRHHAVRRTYAESHTSC